MNSFRMLILAFSIVFSSATFAILQFSKFMQVSPFPDGKYWFLTKNLDYKLLDTEVTVTVPAGFVTDFTSVPRPFWVLLPRWGKYGPPAVVHDFLYWDQRCTRKQADRIMVLAMLDSDVGHFRTKMIHRAVRMGGRFAWKSNQRARKKGRIKLFPTYLVPKDPTVTWEELETDLREQGEKPESRPSPEPAPDYCSQADALWDQRMITGEN